MILGSKAIAGLDLAGLRLLQGCSFVADIFPRQVQVGTTEMPIGSCVAVEAPTIERWHFSELELFDDRAWAQVEVLLHQFGELFIRDLA